MHGIVMKIYNHASYTDNAVSDLLKRKKKVHL